MLKFICTHKPPIFKISKFQEATSQILKKQQPSFYKSALNSKINLNFIDDQQIQKLNKLYRNKNAPTDVLSWSYLDVNLLANQIAGEIYISTETAKRQNPANYLYQLYFLATHGLLHVFHYDHQTDAQEDEMNAITTLILQKIYPS